MHCWREKGRQGSVTIDFWSGPVLHKKADRKPALFGGRRNGGTLIWARVALTDKADEDIMYLDDIYRERQQ